MAGTCLLSGRTLPEEVAGQGRLVRDFILEWPELFEPNEGGLEGAGCHFLLGRADVSIQVSRLTPAT